MKKTIRKHSVLLALGLFAIGAVNMTSAVGQNADSVEELPTQQAVNDESVEEGASESELSASDAILVKLNEHLPHIPFSETSETAIPGIYEAIAEGNIFYVDESGQYIMQGDIIRLSDLANLTNERLGGIHMGMIESIDEKDMLIYEPEEASDRSITVFTDISCGYCRLLHEQIDTLLDDGVRVRYLLFPRAGADSQGFKDLESVWCADNPQEAMTVAKSGGEIIPKTCDNPIEMHMALAQRVGLRGTPLIYTDSGEMITGYREADALVTLIKNSEPMSF